MLCHHVFMYLLQRLLCGIWDYEFDCVRWKEFVWNDVAIDVNYNNEIKFVDIFKHNFSCEKVCLYNQKLN